MGSEMCIRDRCCQLRHQPWHCGHGLGITREGRSVEGGDNAGLWAVVVRSAIYGLIGGSNPEPQAMGMIGALALFVNVIVAVTIGKISLFANAENLLDVRQTKYDPLLLPQRAASGQWTVDAWAPLEGFILNGGIRLRFGGH